MNKRKLRLNVTSAVFCAIIFVVTAYMLHIPTPATQGYIHLGDAFLYIAACLLPTPYAAAAGAVGEAMSDLLTGSAVFAIPTLIIKTLMALCFTSKNSRILTKRNAFAAVGAGLICVAGYYVSEIIMFGSVLAPLAGLPGDVIQASASGIVFAVLAAALDHAGIKRRQDRFMGK